jgi:DNA repair protein RecO (recombination protein O)
MHWTDTAVILSARRHGENSAVIRLFSREHGVYGGVVRSIHSKANRGIIQSGNIVLATWQARLSEQLGAFRCELLEAHAALIMQDAGRLSGLSAACALLEAALPERHPYPRLYKLMHGFLDTLQGNDEWPDAYVRLELDLLADTGFGLDLSQCAATGAAEELIYVSPKSGRAVSRTAGAPYHDKLLPLPPFLQAPHKKNRVESAEILAGMQLTGYFLDHWLLTPHRRKLPAARQRLIETLEEHKAYYGTEETVT